MNNQSEKNNNCFIISPIGNKDSETREVADKLLEFIIKPVLDSLKKEFDLNPIRADQIVTQGIITNQIIDHILNDRLVIADLSNRNPNVFYELALRHAFIKPVIPLMEEGQTLPFDVGGVRTIYYNFNKVQSVKDAKATLEDSIRSVLSENAKIESPVTIAARLPTIKKKSDNAIFIELISALSKKLDDIQNQVCRTEDYREVTSPLIQNKIEKILSNYSNEIDLLKSVKFAGVTGIFKRRDAAIKAFERGLDEEQKEIIIIGSSLKGLLQKGEYSEIRDKIKFKTKGAYTVVKFLLTHPIVADFRAGQEQRKDGDIGNEILKSLKILKEWEIKPENVRLYLGTPTCFAIKTSRQMLINPYPYNSVSFDSPCLHLEYASENSSYFFDEFNSRHFGAWDSDLSIRIEDFSRTIDYIQSNLSNYSELVKGIIEKGKIIQ